MIKPQVVNKLKSINELQLLSFMEMRPQWIHNKEGREFISNLFGIAEITVKTTLKSLLQKTFIEKISKGVYRINKDILQ